MMDYPVASLLQDLALLAQRGRVVNLGERFRPGGSGVDGTNFVVLVVALVAAAVLLSLLARYINTRDQVGQDNPRRLFGELCRAHGLATPERRLLRQLARWHQISQPAQLFVEPHRFESRELQTAFAEQADLLTALQQKLFRRDPSSEEE
jgi:hypothetical protein